MRCGYIIKVCAIAETPGLLMVPKLKYEHVNLASFSK